MAIVGMSRHTGKPITPLEHLLQSITDILTTPRGSRRMRPLYGSLLPRMVDLPVTKGWISAMQAEIATALSSRKDAAGREYGEPRFRLSQAKVVSVLDGRIQFRLVGEYLGKTLSLEFYL
jgi:uncharacterized protein